MTMSDLIPYVHQVGGWHKGIQSRVLKDEDGHILKPVKLNANPTYDTTGSTSPITHLNNDSGKNADKEIAPVCRDELQLYNHVMTSTSQDDVLLKSLMPAYYGSRQIVFEDGTVIPHLILEDLAAGFDLPCVADIKMGSNFYYPGQEKNKQRIKYATQSELGFCVTGLRVFHPASGRLITELRPNTCKQLSISETLEGLDKFCQKDTNFCSSLCCAFVTQLMCIHEWFLKQRSYKIRCGSVLILYDAAKLETPKISSNDSVTAAVNGEPGVCELTPKVRVKMIDFAHVLHSSGERDENYIFGLENLIKFFSNKEQ
ncbi:uncharacterized protein [Procambarus clarkii]|uniref:uncharacterized protein isoform X1 n=1 Tax=Procambarus clarkii TaxID=6728 RepID=UPI001E674885|nr:inositol polyphosphate multikinase beta-like isoform X1 [Procambarus clarkii]XP_045594555.1 inositol polyphosphate multikinase beta-like isoform X1 [Procambarus clarkii]XP_045594557.1 inositol polyphosphate multikinase beta-like isoform X1 [Procambarus clarkii]XP_045594558.1 inositol polyphosphate multikinase beta-like isoform X1 [Procambarus clarkii]XP_045594559.1 inositol polyphosphate multikinase beta-like isoform X1 [Procambarus clarkii]XP_045594560.1 inositol polyphosphate multikinase 